MCWVQPLLVQLERALLELALLELALLEYCWSLLVGGAAELGTSHLVGAADLGYQMENLEGVVKGCFTAHVCYVLTAKRLNSSSC